jgi:hypothetical protein
VTVLTYIRILLTRGVSHCGLAIYIKMCLKAREENLMETQIFHDAKNIIFKKKKKSSKRNQNPSKYYNSVTNLKF